MPKRLLTAAEAAKVLYGDEEKESRIYTMLREGILPGVYLGRQVRIDTDALDEFIRGGGRRYAGGWKKSEA